ncbi:MAG: hypothetical protein A3G13_02710 [Candidatus Levybacteria bacterium RIFCSPLOWO2_12_FULL_37_7]|nr:MAG: hypothetical protein A3G13_02710 [Candidatus Levybacteria bacterium RIFCSPLOWO2_12_FULL_37_7]
MKQRVLILDKQDNIGNIFWQSVKDAYSFVLVSSKKPEAYVRSEDDVYIHYKKERKKLPVIPEYEYEYIFVVYNGEEEIKNSLSELQAQTRKKCIVVLERKYAQDLRERIRDKKNIMFFVLGDVFGNMVSGKNRVEEILVNAYEKGVIEIAKTGVETIYPVHMEDAIRVITKLFFDEKKHSGIFYIFQKNPPTELSFARALKKINPLFKIDFSKQETKTHPQFFLEEGEYCIPDEYLLKKRLEEVLEKGLYQKPKTQSSERSRQTTNSRQAILFIIALCIFFVLLPVVISILSLSLGTYELKKVKEKAEEGKYADSKSHATKAVKIFSFGNSFSPFVLLESSYVGQRIHVQKLTDSLQKGKSLSSTVVKLHDALGSLAHVFLGTAKKPQEDFLISQRLIKESILEFQYLKIDPLVPGDIKQKLESIQDQTVLLEHINEVLLSVLGIDRKKTYLLLFQNNMELRATGGFIGSYATVSFNKGKMEGFSIEDVYEADGKLKGHIDPPEFLQKYMGIKHLFLRDSNYNIDFPKAATVSAFIFKQETGVDIDGVIGIDVSVVKQILKAIGEVKVLDYNKTVTEENVYWLTQEYAENFFFPGSTQKKNFIASLFIAIQNKIATLHSYTQLLDALYLSIAEKHILFAFLDKDMQRPFSVAGVSSAIPATVYERENEIQDFVGINESNIGGNKANYFVQRKVDLLTTLSKEGSVSGKLKINYKNIAEPNTKEIDYKFYVRFILPKKSELLSIGIDDKTQGFVLSNEQQIKNKEGIEVEKYEQGEKTVYGFYLTVPSSSEKKVVITYRLKNTPQIGKIVSYKLRIFKQPGTEEDIWSASFVYPNTFTLFKKDDRMITGEKIAWAKFPLKRDTQFRVDLVRK